MKKVLLIMSAAIIFVACGGGGDKPKEEAKKEPAVTETPKPEPSAESEKVLELIAAKNCAPTCHMIEKKVIGPAYIDVSKKYESTPENIETLAQKVIKGGSGVWGDVPMTPNNVTIEEAREIVTYILSLKNNK
jgi:cytochrome c